MKVDRIYLPTNLVLGYLISSTYYLFTWLPTYLPTNCYYYYDYYSLSLSFSLCLQLVYKRLPACQNGSLTFSLSLSLSLCLSLTVSRTRSLSLSLSLSPPLLYNICVQLLYRRLALCQHRKNWSAPPH